MNAIKLNFINKSNDPNNSDIIIFQKNTGIDFEDTAVAWKVINNCSVGWNHCFELSREINIGAVDSWNNPINSPISAEYGQSSGCMLMLLATTSNMQARDRVLIRSCLEAIFRKVPLMPIFIKREIFWPAVPVFLRLRHRHSGLSQPYGLVFLLKFRRVISLIRQLFQRLIPNLI